MNYKQSRFIFNICVPGGVLLACLGFDLADSNETLSMILCVIGLAAILGSIFQAFLFYKCPKCGKRFDTRAQLPSYCPFCGQYLEPYAQSTRK